MSVIIEFFLTSEAVVDIVVSMKSDSICTYHFSRPRNIGNKIKTYLCCTLEMNILNYQWADYLYIKEEFDVK